MQKNSTPQKPLDTNHKVPSMPTQGNSKPVKPAKPQGYQVPNRTSDSGKAC